MVGELKVPSPLRWGDVEIGGLGQMHPSVHLVLEEFSLRMKVEQREQQDYARILIKQHLDLSLDMHGGRQYIYFLCSLHWVSCFLQPNRC